MLRLPSERPIDLNRDRWPELFAASTVLRGHDGAEPGTELGVQLTDANRADLLQPLVMAMSSTQCLSVPLLFWIGSTIGEIGDSSNNHSLDENDYLK